MPSPTSWIKHAEVYTCAIAAALSVVVAVLDFSGVLHGDTWKWLIERVPTITLLVTGMSLGLLASLIIHHVDGLEQRLHRMQQSVKATVPEKLAGIRTLIDPNLDKVIGSHVADLLEQLNRLIRNRTYELADVELFRAFYKGALEAYRGSHFVATSVPSEKFFWRNQSTERAIAQFINEGGKMTRIFFIASVDDLNSEETRRILVTQSDMGVEVYTAETAGVPAPLRRFFMVEKEGRIAWEPFRATDNSITGINLTSDPDQTGAFLRAFRELMKLDCTQRYVPSLSFIDPHGKFQGKVMKNMPAIPIDPQEFKDFEHRGWEVSVDAYDRYFGPLTQATIGPLLDGVKVASGESVLDLATGPGYVAAAALRRGAEVVGIDFPPE